MTAKSNKARRMTASQIRRRNDDRRGKALLAACALALLAMGFCAYSIDKAQGVSVDQSLDSWGL